jgi:2',3'-cyclic-nucleotide 2'-phosphodiesterase/3'-nucleotidase
MMAPTLPRRRFLQLGVASFASRWLPAGAATGAAQNDTVAVIHTTDLHGNILPTSDYDGNANLGGLARCASRIHEWRTRHPAHLLIDAGDLYQGTEVGFQSRGTVMTDALNHLNYDAWVLGNHEFDWGHEIVTEAISHSKMPVLAANGAFDGKRAWVESQRENSRVRPYLIHQAGDYRIAVIGLTTPGMPNWFLPELLGGFEAHDPLPAFEAVMREVEDQKPDAIILAVHMGGKPGFFRDDEANRVASLAKACRRNDGSSRVAAIIGGHTHQSIPNERVAGTPYTQARFFGIELGRIDLEFNPENRKLVGVHPITEKMDASVPLDPGIIALTRDRVDLAETHLDQAAGELTEEFSHLRTSQKPTDIEQLIGASILEGLGSRGIQVDAAIHGMLFTKKPWPAGRKTIRNVWEIIPFENFIVTAELTLEALLAVAAEAWAERRPLLGLKATYTGRGAGTRTTSIRDADGRELEASRRFKIAFNSYDAAGGGGKLPLLRRVLDEPASKRTFHPLQSRALLVDFLNRHQPLGLDQLRA